MQHPSIDMASNSTTAFGQNQIAGNVSNLGGKFVGADNYGSYALHTDWNRGNTLNREQLVHLSYPNQMYAPYYFDHSQGLRMNQMGIMNMTGAEKMANTAARNGRQSNVM